MFKTVFTLIILAAFAMTGCEKEIGRKTECRIISATNPSSGEPYHFTYNADGRIIRSVGGTFVKNYAYAGDSVIIGFLHSGEFVNRTFVHLNDAGMAAWVRVEGNPEGTSWVRTAYEYNGKELVKSSVITSGNAKPSVTTYEWSDGNLVSRIHETEITHFEYYTDKPGQAGDHFFLTQLTEGYEIYKPKNLIKTIGNSNIAYEFNAGGKISASITTTGDSRSVLIFDYACNEQ